MSMATPKIQKPRMVGINHLALEVGDVEAALEFYGKIFNFKLRGKSAGMAFIDLGDQFIALFEDQDNAHKDKERHFGLVVDDRTHIKELAKAAGAELLEAETIEFFDPWGNRIQIVEYKDIQFSKTPGVLKAMGLNLPKTDDALSQLIDKGMQD